MPSDKEQAPTLVRPVKTKIAVPDGIGVRSQMRIGTPMVILGPPSSTDKKEGK